MCCPFAALNLDPKNELAQRGLQRIEQSQDAGGAGVSAAGGPAANGTAAAGVAYDLDMEAEDEEEEDEEEEMVGGQDGETEAAWGDVSGEAGGGRYLGI